MSGLTENLRAVVNLLEAHPDLPVPCVWGYTSDNVTVQWQLMNNGAVKYSQRVAAAAIRKAVGGAWVKSGGDSTFSLRCSLDGLNLEILADREQVCERIVVGTETVTVPAVEARPERIEEREVIEWRCDPVLEAVPS